MPDWAAACIDPDDNRLLLNLDWEGLLRVHIDWMDETAVPAALRGQVLDYLTGRHAVRLVARVLLHENDAAERPDGAHPELLPEALSVAGHWDEADLRDARRVINSTSRCTGPSRALALPHNRVFRAGRRTRPNERPSTADG